MLNKIIVGVLASDNGGYANMVQACRDTCYSKSHIPENVSVFYIYGHRQGITTPEKSKVIGDCFYHNHPESRRNIIYKTIAFFEYCCDNFEFDYIYRPNCGSYVNLSILNGIANELPSKNLYFGTTLEKSAILFIFLFSKIRLKFFFKNVFELIFLLLK